MIILGIDPGTNRLGYALIDKRGRHFNPLVYGCWEFSIRDRPYRLKQINKNIRQLIKKYHPEYLAIEGIYFFKNAKTVMQISEARGVILLTAAVLKIPIIELAPLEIKQKLTGYGRSDKKEIQKKVTETLKLKTCPKLDDTSDALAIALAAFKKLQI